VFGQSERRKLFDMADDCLGNIAAIEKGFVEQGYREGFHIFAHAGHQRQASAQQFFRQFFADIALVAEQLADQNTFDG
jgi:hypothetical protein